MSTMKVLLEITDSKYSFVMELLKSFKFVKATTISNQKARKLNDMKTAIDQMKLIEENKLKGIPARELLNEL